MNQNNNLVNGESPRKIYSWYLIAVIVYSALALLVEGGLSILAPESTFMDVPWSWIRMLWFWFNVIMLVTILVKKVEKVGLVLPILFIAKPIILLPIAFIVGALAGLRETTTEKAANAVGLSVVVSALLFNVLTLGIAVKLLRRKE